MTQASDAIWISSSFAIVDKLKKGSPVEFPRDLMGSAVNYPVARYILERRTLSRAARLLTQAIRQGVRGLTEGMRAAI